jgi:hypothetical protein
MTLLRPRQTSHRGSVMAAGLAVDTRITREQEARRRILRLPSRGLGVFRVGPVLVVRFPAPARLDAATAGGALLVRYGRLLSAAPLDADEQEALSAHPGAAKDMLVLVDGGSAGAGPLNDEACVDISEWIDVSGFSIAGDLQALGAVQPEPHAATVAPVGTVRQSFGMAPLDRDAAEMLHALSGRPAPGSARGGAAGQSWLPRALDALWLGLRGRWSAAPVASPPPPPLAGEGKEGAGAARGGSPSPRPGWLGAFRDLIARAVWSSRMGRLLGRRYAAYLSRVLDMLDAQDYDNALRHAVPLNDEVSATLRPPPLGLPTARADLAIRPKRPAGKTTLGLGGELFELLRQRYRRAFERLDALGKVEMAAFVLAELLNATEEAVSYLERHRQLRLAAELAEARKLPPGLVIRLWFLAGDRARAVHIARLTGAFADAVLRLERSHKEEGRILRLMWADALATAGAYAAAVDAAWPVAEARRLVRAWMDRAIAVGGPTGARMLARKIRVAPEEFAGLRDQALGLLGREAEDDTVAVRAFAQELADHEPTAEARALAGPMVRRLLPESGEADVQRLTDRLLNIAAPVFAADVRAWQHSRGSPRAGDPAHPKRVPLQLRPEPLDIHRLADDRGGIAVADAAALPDGRTLVAAGELGVFLLSRDGKVMTRFAEPAHAIVISDQGDRAILLARRGEMFRVSRLDLVTRCLQPWCDARFTGFAADFDGAVWFVARGDTIYAVDAAADRWQYLWKVDERGAFVHAVGRDARWMSALIVGRGQCEVWTYELPSITLRRRQPVTWRMDGSPVSGIAAVAPQGLLAGMWRRRSEPPDYEDWPVRVMAAGMDGRWKDLPVTAPEDPTSIAVSNGWIALSLPEWRAANAPSRWWRVIHLLDTGNLAVRMRIAIDVAGPAGVRIQGDRLIVFDGSGRVIAISLSSGAVLREHRLT